MEGAGGGDIDTEESTDRYRLPGPVRAEEPEGLALVDVEGKVTDDCRCAEVHSEVGDVDKGLGAGRDHVDQSIDPSKSLTMTKVISLRSSPVRGVRSNLQLLITLTPRERARILSLHGLFGYPELRALFGADGSTGRGHRRLVLPGLRGHSVGMSGAKTR